MDQGKIIAEVTKMEGFADGLKEGARLMSRWFISELQKEEKERGANEAGVNKGRDPEIKVS